MQYKRSLLVFTFALLFTLPYLFYTYSLTGRFFYWSNAGGTTIYWMSTPYAEEFGDWFNADLQPNGSIDGSAENAQQKLIENHQQHHNKILRYTGVERDDAFKRKGFENIRNYPVKYFKNWIANIGRLLFNYPQSYRKPGIGMYLNMIPNMFVVVLGALLIVPAFKISRNIPFFMKFLMLLCLIYLAGSSLVSAMIRMFYIIVPIIGLWLAYVSSRTIQFKYSDSAHQNA